MTNNRWVEQYFLIFIILVLFCLVVLPLATPVVLGLLIAMTCNPANELVNRLFKNRPYLAALTTTTFFTICVVLPLVLIGIAVVKEASGFMQKIAISAKDFDLENSIDLLKNNKKLYDFIPFSEGELKEKVELILTKAGTTVAQYLAAFVSSLPIIGLEILIFILSFYYGLVDGQNMTRFIAKCLPFERDEISDLFTMTRKICDGVVIGSVVAGLTQGIVMGLAYWMLGVPGALLFGAITAIFSFVPILGSGPTGLGGIIYLLAQGQKGSALLMLLALVIASVSDNVVKPVALKGSVELHPLLGLVSALGALAVFGFVGLFLGPLFSGFMIVVLDMLQKRNSLLRDREHTLA